MAKHMLDDSENKYMEFKDIALKKPLNSVKRTDKKNDTLVIPDNLLPIISRFFEAEDVKYSTIENPALYPADKLKAGLKAYEDCSPTFLYAEPVLFITPFDSTALFEWSKQLLAKTSIQAIRHIWMTSEKHPKNITRNTKPNNKNMHRKNSFPVHSIFA